MQLHVTSSFYQLTQNCTGVFNAAAEAKLCSRPESYGRNPDPSNAGGHGAQPSRVGKRAVVGDCRDGTANQHDKPAGLRRPQHPQLARKKFTAILDAFLFFPDRLIIVISHDRGDESCRASGKP